MRIFFQHPAMDGQLNRLIGHAYFGCADIGECMITASHIVEGDFDSWHDEWSRTADRIFNEAEVCAAEKNLISAREAYLRASNYYRASLFFLYSHPVSPKLLETYRKHELAFACAAQLFNPQFEAVKIPFEGTTLPGYFYAVDDTGTARPTFIVNGGYDSTHQESYFHIVQSAQRRGYNVLAFDGPGQGEMLIRRNVPMRYNWETVITPVVDYLMKRTDVNKKKIFLYGPSWGGMLAPRAAAFEERLAGLVVNPGYYDVLEAFQLAITGAAEKKDAAITNIDVLLQAAMSDKYVAAKFKARMFAHGAEGPHDLLEQWKNYNLIGVADKIKCPTLVCYSENEHLCPGQAKVLFDVLQCPKNYAFFSAAEGAGEHCAAGASGLLTQRVFDWATSIA